MITFVNILFTSKISNKELIRLNSILKRLDNGAPEFTNNGYVGEWNGMLYNTEAISNLINKFGYSNKFKFIENLDEFYKKANNPNFNESFSYQFLIQKELAKQEWKLSNPSIEDVKNQNVFYYSYWDRKRFAKELNRFSRRFV